MKGILVGVVLVLAGVFSAIQADGQSKITILDSGHNKTSLRGLSVVNDNILWASGSNGTVAKSIDGGKKFEWLTVAGYESRDFRDVEAFSKDTVLIMAVDLPAVILKTYNGGKTWKEVFRDTTKGMFLDAMDFSGKFGAVVGDPINNFAFMAFTTDAGETWNGDWKYKNGHLLQRRVKLAANEAFFASSGTNVKVVIDSTVNTTNSYYVSGGSKAGLIVNEAYVELPSIQGGQSQGANSIDIFNGSGVVVGGDFAHDTVTRGNCMLIKLGKGLLQIDSPKTPPHGYRSCVIYLTKNNLITCGTSGVDFSNDGGNNWQLISLHSFHVCQKAKHGNAVFLAGANGKIAVYR